MKVLDLFSGIGGFSLGLEWAGMSTKAMCEKDPYCRKVLSKHWPGLKIHEDIRDLDGKEYANSIDVVAGGFPCQPFSVAGERKGKLDDRHLWPEMFRVIKESKPRWVLGENVFGFINMALDDVQSDLESEHYEVRKFVLPAVAVDARHRRDRCFVIAYSNSDLIRNKPRWGDGENGQSSPISTDHGEAQSMADSRCKSEGFSLNRSGSERIRSEEKRQWSEEGDGFTNSGQALAYTNGERKLQQRGTEQEVGGWIGNSGEQDVTHTNGERLEVRESIGEHTQSELQTIERSHSKRRENVWLPEPGVGRVADGIPGRVDRLKGLGNAVVPQLIQAIGEIVIKADREIYS
jgi:DNA (cytosine-5)-methyltransferase 1